MIFTQLLQNPAFVSGMLAWMMAQVLKLPFEYWRKGKWNWGYLLSAGGMPSSHSALMVSITMGIGLHVGFNTDLFALAASMTMIVIYDAAGVRREAGRHAEKINMLMNELFAGHPISDRALREVLGHTPMEVLAGIFLGLTVSLVYWLKFG